MDIQNYITKAGDLGYSVGIAIEGHGGHSDEEGSMPTVYRIEGPGFSTQLTDRSDDEASWASLVNPVAHEHRTLDLRHGDPEDEFEWEDDRARLESSLRAAVATSSMSEEDARQALESYDKEQSQ